jgi:uncharacterized coiled-coil protein SlyX
VEQLSQRITTLEQ